MSLLTYNGVSLPYASTMAFNQQALYDEEGQTDFYCTKFDIQMQCIINRALLAKLAADLLENGVPADNVKNASSVMRVIRKRLMTPRRTLSYVFNGEEQIPQITKSLKNSLGPEIDLNVDSKNGPQPQKCDCVMVTNETFIMTYHIIAHYWEKNKVNIGAGQTLVENVHGNPILYNRWTETVSLDHLQMSRRTRSGRARLNSNTAEDEIDTIRARFAHIGVPSGFLRQSSEYTISPDGLTMQYRVTDVEQFKMPPNNATGDDLGGEGGAYRASGQYSETLSKYGAIRTGQVNVTLEGRKDTPQEKLVELAISVGANKLQWVGAQLDAVGFLGRIGFSKLESASLNIDMYKNIVSFSARAWLKMITDETGSGRYKGLAGFGLAGITKTPLSDSDNGVESEFAKQPNYTMRGSAGVLLEAAKYWDPNLSDNKIDPSTENFEEGDNPGEGFDTDRSADHD